MLATIGCGSSGGGGTGGTGAGMGGSTATGGTKGNGGAGGAATGGSPGSGGTSATGGTTGSGGAGQAGASGNAGSTGTGGAGGAFAPATLVVDNDESDNNDPTNTSPVASSSDALFASLLSGEQISSATFVVPSDTGIGPVFAQLGNVSTIIWYTGAQFDSTMSSAQQTTLENWLDVGNKTLIIFSENLMFNLSLDWTDTHSNTFAATYLGLLGAQSDVDTAGGNLDDVNYTAIGNTGVPAFNGLSFAIDSDTNLDITTADAVNPATGTDTLLTAPADPTGTGTDSPTPVASGHTKGTSKVIYVGIPIESVHGAPTNTSAQLFHACLKYAGLKTN
jgi:hypothetical protein